MIAEVMWVHCHTKLKLDLPYFKFDGVEISIVFDMIVGVPHAGFPIDAMANLARVIAGFLRPRFWGGRWLSNGVRGGHLLDRGLVHLAPEVGPHLCSLEYIDPTCVCGQDDIERSGPEDNLNMRTHVNDMGTHVIDMVPMLVA